MDFKSQLDHIQKEIFASVKPLGFKKRGRTFNRMSFPGIYQVINFQMGQFPLGNHTALGGINDNFYGQFTINLGICLEDVFTTTFPYSPKEFYQEYDCQVRERLSMLVQNLDCWWSFSTSPAALIRTIRDDLEKFGLPWLNKFGHLESFKENWTANKSLRAKLDFGIFLLKHDKAGGTKLIREYYHEQVENHSRHKEYVYALACELGISLQDQ